jgi:hypothetical protein
MSGDGKTAFIEMAAASGLGLVPPAQRNPLVTTSRGTGELIFRRWIMAREISLSVLAVAQRTTAARAWCRRWAQNSAMPTAKRLGTAAVA